MRITNFCYTVTRIPDPFSLFLSLLEKALTSSVHYYNLRESNYFIPRVVIQELLPLMIISIFDERNISIIADDAVGKTDCYLPFILMEDDGRRLEKEMGS